MKLPRLRKRKTPDWDKIADLLDTWGECRMGYLRERGVGEPVQVSDLDYMEPNDLMLWAQATAVQEAAMILREPELARQHLPKFTHDKWNKALIEALD
jgi:hypothetical protein